MIEALFLMSAIFAVILISYYISRSPSDSKNKSLGIFTYVDTSDKDISKSSIQGNSDA